MSKPAAVTGKTTVSVALCTHNGATFLQEQMESILNQTRSPDEIVISDDASSDATIDVLQTSLAHVGDTNVTFLRNERTLGVTANFAQALAACTGNLVALCDQDDVWDPKKLERMAAEFDSRPHLLLLHSDARIVGRTGATTGATLFDTLHVTPDEILSVHRGDTLDVLLRRNIVTGATAMLRRELVERVEPFPASWVHDEWLAAVAAAIGEVDLIEEQLIDYRQHGGNEIGATTLNLRGRISRLRAPRSARNARLLARAESLLERFSAPGFVVSQSVEQKAREKVEHERVRGSFPANRMRRIRPVLAEWNTGRYRRYGLGLQDVARDLAQPL